MRTWVKLHTIILADPKMFGLSDHHFRVFVNLIALAGFLDRDGELGTEAEIAFHLRAELPSMASDLVELGAVGITCERRRGVWHLVNWDKFQSPKPPSAKPDAILSRVRKSRERRKTTGKQVNGNDVTGSLQNSLQEIGNDSVTTSRKEKNREEIEERINTSAAGAATPEPDLVKELATVFEKAAGIKMPTPNTEKGQQQVGVLWWHPLREMVAIANGQAPALLQKAVAQMRHDKLTIAAPNSVLKVFTSLHGESASSAPARAEFTPEEKARIQAELRARKVADGKH